VKDGFEASEDVGEGDVTEEVDDGGDDCMQKGENT